MLLDSILKSSSIEYNWAVVNELNESSELAEMYLQKLNEFLPNLLVIQESFNMREFPWKTVWENFMLLHINNHILNKYC